MRQLAIVIPAYKIEFFKATLESLANQTCKDFTVYIGDDCSPADFESLVGEYKSKLDIVYHKFPTNMGGENLVGQWKRCIELSQGEPWIWLFSDDDVIGSKCVESFYKTIEIYPNHDLYHFNIDAINEKGEVIFECRRFPDVISSVDFYKKKENDDIDSFVVEYIFSRKIYDETGGFQNFDLAWGADTATWVKFAYKNGIRNISGDKVYWRKSYANITPNRDKQMSYRKFLINVCYFDWVNKYFDSENISKFNSYAFFRNFVFYSRILSHSQLGKVSDKAVEYGIITSKKKTCFMLMLPLIRIGKLIKTKIKKKRIQ